MQNVKYFNIVLHFIHSPVEKPTKTPISIDLSNLQFNPITSPSSPGGVSEPYDVKTPAMLRLVQRQMSEGDRYPGGNCFIHMYHFLYYMLGLR